MTIKIDQRFKNFTTASAEYPHGSAKNETTPRQSNDGTVVDALIINDNYGYICAVLAEAGIEPSNQPDNAITSDVLKAQKTIFMPQLIDGGDWSNVAGSQITRLNSRQFWLYQGESYVVSPSVTNFPITAPNDPTTQPSIYIKARFITRSEFELHQQQVEKTLSDIQKNYLPIAGGMLTGDLNITNPVLDAGEAKLNLSEGGHISISLELSYDGAKNLASFGTRYGSAGRIDFMTVERGSTKPDFKGLPAVNGKELATQEYADNKSESALESANEYTDEQAAIIVKKAVPVGSLVDFAIEKDREGYLRCNGKAYPIASYPELGAELGDFFNRKEDPSSVFRVPNMPIEAKGELQTIANTQFDLLHGLAFYKIDGVNYLAVVDANSNISGANKGGVFIYDLNNLSSPVQEIMNSDFSTPVGAVAYTSNGVTFLAVVDRSSDEFAAGDGGVFIYDTRDLSRVNRTISNYNFINPTGLAAYTINNVDYLAVVDSSADLGGRYGGGVFIYNVSNFNAPRYTITNDDMLDPAGVAAYKMDGVNYLAVVDSFTNHNAVYIYDLNNRNEPSQTIVNDDFKDTIGLAAYTIDEVNYLAVVDRSSDVSGVGRGGVFIYDLRDISSPVQTIVNSDFYSPNGLAAYEIEGVNYLAISDAYSALSPVGRGGVYIYALDNNKQFQIVPYIKS